MRILVIIFTAAACLVAVLLYYRRNKLNAVIRDEESAAGRQLMARLRSGEIDGEAFRRHETEKIKRISGMRGEDESVTDAVISYMRSRSDKKGLSFEVRDKEMIEAFFRGMDERSVIEFLYNMLENAVEGAENLYLSEKSERLSGSPDILLYGEGDDRIICRNIYDSRMVNNDGGDFKTSKKDAERHGFGLYAMNAVAKRYGLALDVVPDDDEFVVRVGR